MLVLAGLLQRGFGFLASLALARQAGLDAVGLYTGLQISSNSPTSPLSAPLANSATLVATEHRGEASMQDLVRAHFTALFATAGFAALGSAGLMWWSVSQTSAWQQWPRWLPLLFVVLLSISTVGGQLMAGLLHGVNRSLPLAQVTMACTLLGVLLCWPVASLGGMLGALSLSTAVVALPGLVLGCWAWSQKGQGSHSPRLLRQAVASRMWLALPNVASTLIRNGVNWYCCIYLAQKYHGPAGVGLVTIGLQWMMLMQLPTLAWGGRMVADMGQAQQISHASLRQAMLAWLRKCIGSTAAIGVLVACGSSLISQLYQLQDTPLPWVLMANALVSALLAGTFVLERVYFCQARQRAWFVLSVLGDATQLALTLYLARYSVLVVSLGSLSSALLVFAGGQWMLRRHHQPIASQS